MLESHFGSWVIVALHLPHTYFSNITFLIIIIINLFFIILERLVQD